MKNWKISKKKRINCIKVKLFHNMMILLAPPSSIFTLWITQSMIYLSCTISTIKSTATHTINVYIKLGISLKKKT